MKMLTTGKVAEHAEAGADRGRQPEQIKELDSILFPGMYPKDSEIVFALVAPLGARLDDVQAHLRNELEQRDYKVHLIRLSDFLDDIQLKTKIDRTSHYQRIRTLQNAGNEARRQSKCQSYLALNAIAEIARLRREGDSDGVPRRTAYIIRSLKRPEEAELLRSVYGTGFFLIGIHSSMSSRRENLRKLSISGKRFKDLVARDENEDEQFGQRTRDTFELSDGFITDDARGTEALDRFVDLLYGALYVSPTKDEVAMYMAYCASLRSADLSRQVGAAIASDEGDVLAVGCNDVPKAGGGLYWTGDKPDMRDFRLEYEFTLDPAAEPSKRDDPGYDPNAKMRDLLGQRIVQAIDRAIMSREGQGALGDLPLDERNQILRESGLLDITEYGRSVHAEMEALMSCARRGISTSGKLLFTTTFPCHNCARHIVASGLSKVTYVEPYPKSQGLKLHPDSIYCPALQEGDRPTHVVVEFVPYVGLGPRKFWDIYSMRLYSGKRIERKRDGDAISQSLEELKDLRIPMTPLSYLGRETVAISLLGELVGVSRKVPN